MADAIPLQDRRDCLNPKAQEALSLFMKCLREHFNGSFKVSFNDGIPQLCDRTETIRFGRHPRHS